MKNPFSRRTPQVPAEPSRGIPPQNLRIVTEYVMNMSITCLAGEDISPLFEDYMEDTRLGAVEKDELTQAYLVLHLRAVQAAAN